MLKRQAISWAILSGFQSSVSEESNQQLQKILEERDSFDFRLGYSTQVVLVTFVNDH